MSSSIIRRSSSSWWRNVGVLLSTALLINFFTKGRIQHIIRAKRTRIINTVTRIWASTFCHPLIQLKYWSHGSVIPEFFFNSSDRSSNFFIAKVTLPFGPVLSGMYVQQVPVFSYDFTKHLLSQLAPCLRPSGPGMSCRKWGLAGQKFPGGHL